MATAAELRTRSLIGGTLATDVLHRIREDIISCVLKPGERLRFEQLRAIYDVSFSTLREALSHLASERLVIAHGQRGFVVAPISAEELLDLADARVLLEREAIRLAMEKGDEAWKARIRSSFHRLDHIEASLSGLHRIASDWDIAHADFHDALVTAATSPTLSEMRHALFERARRYRQLYTMLRMTPSVKRAEHREIMEVVLDGDIPTAQAFMEGHIRKMAEHIVANGLDAVGSIKNEDRAPINV